MSSIAPIADALGQLPNEIAHVHDGDEYQQPPKRNSVCLRFSFEIDVPCESFRQRERLPVLLDEIAQRIHQMGLLVVESVRPGSVRIICLATDETDIDRFFAAYRAGSLSSLNINNPLHLPGHRDDDSDIEDTPSAEPDNTPAKEGGADAESIKAIAKGAAAGAVVGTVVPGIGTVIGSLVGGLLGALAAKNKSAKTEMGPEKHKNRS